MAIGEFVSVYTQYDIEMSQLKKTRNGGDDKDDIEKENLQKPGTSCFCISACIFGGRSVATTGCCFIREHRVRLGLVVAVASLALVVFGVIGAKLGRTPVRRSCARLLVGGWMAMAITFGMTKLIGCSGLEL